MTFSRALPSADRVSLPIDEHLDGVADVVRKNQVTLLRATPGAGKTTRVPAFLSQQFRKILVVEPRRIACVSSAQRICEENGFHLGEEVGYEVRFDRRTQPQTRVTFMTDGLFLRKWTENLPYDLVILDEFHERTSSSELLLGLLKESLEMGSPLKLMMMSATLNEAQLQNYFSKAGLSLGLYDVKGRVYPLRVEHATHHLRAATDDHFFNHLLEAGRTLWNSSQGSALIFLPGLREIRHAKNLFQSKFPNIPLDELHGQLTLEEQRRVLTPSSERRFIFSTNIAESSVTVDGVDAVLDTGLERNSYFDQQTQLSRLDLNKISLFSAQQRSGRAARQRAGICLRLWTPSDEKAMSSQSEPEILRADLRWLLLQLCSLGIRNFQSFSWLEKPSEENFGFAQEALSAHGLITHENLLTPQGKKILSHPLGLDAALLFEKAHARGETVLGAHLASLLEENRSTRLSKDPHLSSDVHSLLQESPSFERKKVVETLLGSWKAVSEFQETQVTQILLESRFDQVCQRREPGSLKAKHFSGKGAELHSDSSCLKTDFFVGFHAQARDSDVLVRCAHGVNKNDLLAFAKDSLRTSDRVEVDWEKLKTLRVRQRFLGTFLLDESKMPESFHALREKIQESLIEALKMSSPWLPESWRSFRSLHRWVEAHGQLSPKEQTLFQSPPPAFWSEFSAALVEGAHDLPEVFEKNWKELYLILHPAGSSLRSLLEKFPDSISLMNGKVKKISYENSTPEIEGRVQDFYGVRVHPCLLQGRIKLKVILLGPHQRPIQITSDLPSFWKSSYPSIKKELKGQYPKHFWPDNPESESPPIPKSRK